MIGLDLVRGISALAMPIAAALVWRQRGRLAEPTTTGSTSTDQSTQQKVRLDRRELLRWVAEGRDMAYVDISHMDLRKVDLRGCRLSGADLRGTRLARGKLANADLSYAILDFADLTNSDLRGVNLVGASLVETTLWNADLRGADLSNCRNIVMANIRRAQYDGSTRWPRDLDPRVWGAVRHDGRHA